jgi:protein-disulfide isomerase
MLARMQYESASQLDHVIADFILERQLSPDVAGQWNVNDQEAESFFTKNKASFPPSMNFQDAKELVKAHLKDEKKRTSKNDILLSNPDKLKVSHPFRFCSSEINFPTEDLTLAVGKSSDDPMRIVFYSSSDCQECRLIWPHLSQIADKKGVQLRILPMKDQAEDPSNLSARALYCASQSGPSQVKSYLDAVSKASLQYVATGASLKDYIGATLVRQLQLPGEEFQTCLKADSTNAYVQKLGAIHDAMGNMRSPIVFVNGRILLIGTAGYETKLKELNLAISRP